MRKFIYIILLVVISNLYTNAQDQNNNSDKKISIEEIQQKQLDFFTKELDLTTEQSEKLSPFLQKYMLDRFQLFHKSPHRKPESSMTETEYREAVEDMLKIKTKEVELQNEYFKNLLQILPAEKVYKYQFVEKKYFREITQKNKRKPDSNK